MLIINNTIAICNCIKGKKGQLMTSIDKRNEVNITVMSVFLQPTLVDR